MKKGEIRKKLIVGKDGVATVIEPGRESFETVDNSGNIKAIKDRMYSEYEDQARRLNCSVSAMPTHAINAALNGIFWKNISTWPGSRSEFNAAFRETFKGPLATLSAAGQKPDMIGAEVKGPRKATRNEVRGKLWAEVLQMSMDKFKKHPDQLTVAEFESLKFDVRAKSPEHLRELNGWARKVGSRPTPAQIVAGQPAAVSDAILSEVNRIEEINSNLKALSSELEKRDVAWIRVAGQPAVKLHSPRVKIGDDNKLRIGHTVGEGALIPVWETDLTAQPLTDVRMDSPGIWTIITDRVNNAMVTINMDSAPEHNVSRNPVHAARSTKPLAILSGVAGRDPWEVQSNDEEI